MDISGQQLEINPKKGGIESNEETDNEKYDR